MRQFRVYYCAGSDPRFWCCDIEVQDTEAWDDALTNVKALPDLSLFPSGVELTKSTCEFTSALELGVDGYKGESFSTTPREVTSDTFPDPVDFPKTVVVEETTFGKPMRRVTKGLSKNYKKYRNSAERAKVGLDAGTGFGVGNS